jgi:2-dehydro-3-deoxyphosphooctonate aldolase (KDO 8-P synthase)|tara:strand:+ start:4031 stop:4807 length:777 start_codon:yes stop_codon:yes gene_type:complete
MLEKNKLTVISGPCVLENVKHAIFMAKEIKSRCDDLDIQHIFKVSWDKANRTALDHYRGYPLDETVDMFREIKSEVDVPILTDFHESWQAEKLKDVIDVLQIPAFLCRQTDMLVCASKTGLPINVKKGQFISAEDTERIVGKVKGSDVWLTERGNIFGYGNYVVDMRNLVIMKRFAPVIFDATHSVQQGAKGGSSGSQKEFIEPLAKAAVSVGVDGVFMEVHDNPTEALSDGTSSLDLKDLTPLLKKLKTLYEINNTI